MNAPTLSTNLIYHRKVKGFSQERLSDKTGVTVRTIQRIEKGEVNPHPETIHLLANGLEIKVDDLVVLKHPKDENIQLKWLLIMHGLPIIGLVVPLFNVLASIFLWIHKREDHPIFDGHGRAIINFQITVTILFALSFIALMTIEMYGFFMFVSIIPFSIIVMLSNIFYVLKTQKCWYPLSIPFLKITKLSNSKLLPLVVLSLFSVAQAGISQQKEKITRLDGTSVSKDSLNIKIAKLVEAAHVHGLSLAVFENNQMTYQKNFGYTDFVKKLNWNVNTNIYGASLSKAVFAVLVMKLVEEKVIDLDTPLESYLPKKVYEYPQLARWHDDYTDLKNDKLYHKITARMCLAHTTGMPNWRWFEPNQKLKILFEPGSRYSYSGEGLTYLQVVLERILGKGLEELAQEKIFKPLGMNHTSYQWQTSFANDIAYGHNASGELYEKDTDNEPRGASTLETTSNDYALFLEAALNQKVISSASWNEIFKPQIRIRSIRQVGVLSERDSTLNDDIQLCYGLGWGVLQSPYGKGVFKEGHGDGFQHYTILFPEAKKGIMLLSNSDNAEGIFKQLLELVIRDTYTPWQWENYIPYDAMNEKVSAKD